MKEKQNRLVSYLAGYLPFSSEYSQKYNYNGKAANPLALQTRQRKKLWNTHELDGCNIVDGLSKDTKNVIRGSPADDLHGPVFKHLSGVKDMNMLKADGNDKDVSLNSPELECSIIMNDYANHNKQEPVDSVPPVVTSSTLFQADRICTDEDDFLDYDPELSVCCKEINDNVVKEIWVDEGMPLEDEGLIELHFNNYSGPRANVYTSVKEPGDHNIELSIHDVFKVSSEEDADVHFSNKCLAKEEGNIASPCLADLMRMDDQSPEVLLQTSEEDAGKKITNDVLDEKSIDTRALPRQKTGTRRNLQSVMKISDKQEDEVRLPKQVVEHADKDERHQESVSDNKYRNYSKSPTFISEVLSSSLYGSYMNIHQGNRINYYEGHSANTFEAPRSGVDGKAVSGGQIVDMDANAVNINQQPLATTKMVDSESPFPLNDCKNICETGSIQKSPQQLSHEAWSSSSPANSEVQSAGVNEIAGNASFIKQGEPCNIEAISCAESGQITDSGHITYSGNTSMRSESSTTSTGSFSFPVLQTEWNSSPAKMGDANKRRLGKMCGNWKQGILCCRF
ncbi:hypothetical protein LIER_14005 [Lithospermum erythrorhizon]|uniref:Uncharacterized protein n=1 Tax=Lithospermum erythrorhizon TaxID=34254 RepID=A0AAV3PZQ2_LITER